MQTSGRTHPLADQHDKDLACEATSRRRATDLSPLATSHPERTGGAVSELHELLSGGDSPLSNAPLRGGRDESP
jgi:hypothetical protein